MDNLNLSVARINASELMDIVDPEDNVVGTALRKEIYSAGVNNYRVVNVFLFNADNEIWLPVRSKDKSIFPNCYDFSCGEHVNSGETYENAALRGIEEELNLTVTLSDIEELAYLKPAQVSSFMKIFKLMVAKEPEYNQRDFTGAAFHSIEEIKEMIGKSPSRFKSDIPKVIKVLFG